MSCNETSLNHLLETGTDNVVFELNAELFIRFIIVHSCDLME